MKKKLTYLFVFLFAFTASFAQIEGTWKMAPIAQALAVGPAQGDFSWWSNSADDVNTRACFFDDQFIFNADGSFENVQDGDTWLEPWQGMDPEGCGTPIAPHDGSNAATWSYDAGASTITITGVGAHLGLAKVHNGGELSSPGDAVASITYPVVIAGNTMTIDIDFGGIGFWHFVLEKEVAASPAEGTWKMAPIAQALAVGPALGDFSWWSNSADDVNTRACFFDDEFIFNADGTFENVQGGDTWLEPWQGMDPEGCGAPIAPHDGSNAATWAYDAGAGTITITGVGAHLGLAKVHNGGELSSPGDAVASITYPVVIDGNTMTIDIDFGGIGYWHFVLQKGTITPPADLPSMPLDFESATLDYNPTGFGAIDFGPIPAAVIANPDATGENTSANVLNITKPDGAQTWAGASVKVDAAVDLSAGTVFTVKAWAPDAGTTIRLKMEDSNDPTIYSEVDAMTVGGGAWETLTFDLSTAVTYDAAHNYDVVVLFPNFNIMGVGDVDYYFDDVQQVMADVDYPTLPIDFESPDTDYLPIGFGSASFGPIPTEIIANPDASGENTSATVWHVNKQEGAQPWAGASMRLDAPIDFTTGNSISMKVWSPAAGTPIMLKIEDLDSPPDGNGNPSVISEVIRNSTQAATWETIVYDMSEHPDFVATNEYDGIVVFPNFNTAGAAPDTSYFFDDIMRDDGNSISEADLAKVKVKAFPNPTENELNLQFSIPVSGLVTVDLVDLLGRTVQQMNYGNLTEGNYQEITDVSGLTAGVYFMVMRLDGEIISTMNISVK